MRKINGTIFRFELPLSKKSKNKKILTDFIKYCISHPGERFWQALRNWAKKDFICFARRLIKNNEWTEIQDTFYFEGKDK